MGVRDQFRLGGLRSVARYFLHCLPETQVVFHEYYMIFLLLPEYGYLKISRGLQPPPPPPRLVRYMLPIINSTGPSTRYSDMIPL